MANFAIIDVAKKALAKPTFQLKKHSPEILVVMGVGGIVASTIMACNATLKVNELIDDTKEQVDAIRRYANDENYADRYTPEDAKKDLATTYVQTGVKLAKLYGPSVAVGVASLACILSSHNILRKRNIALAAAYATVDKSFKEYRNRVVERFGETVDHELKHAIKAAKIEEIEVDEATGKEKKVKKNVEVSELDGYSEYARFFDEASRNWEKDSELNLMFLRKMQFYFNDLLKARGGAPVFLNEVYDALDIPRSTAGQIVGWKWDPSNPNIDNAIDFGIYNVHRQTNRDFVNGYEPSILLDFNVDGVVLDL